MQRTESEHHRRNHNRDAAYHNLGYILATRTFQFAKKNSTPQQSDQRVGIPHRKSYRQANISNGKDRQRVRDSPQRPREECPHDQVFLLSQVGEDVRGSLQQRRECPPRRKHSGHHAKRDRKR